MYAKLLPSGNALVISCALGPGQSPGLFLASQRLNIVCAKVRGRWKFVGCEQCGQCVALSLMTTRQDGHLRANMPATPLICAGCERLPIRQNKQTKKRIRRIISNISTVPLVGRNCPQLS